MRILIAEISIIFNNEDDIFRFPKKCFKIFSKVIIGSCKIKYKKTLLDVEKISVQKLYSTSCQNNSVIGNFVKRCVLVLLQWLILDKIICLESRYKIVKY